MILILFDLIFWWICLLMYAVICVILKYHWIIIMVGVLLLFFIMSIVLLVGCFNNDWLSDPLVMMTQMDAQVWDGLKPTRSFHHYIITGSKVFTRAVVITMIHLIISMIIVLATTCILAVYILAVCIQIGYIHTCVEMALRRPWDICSRWWHSSSWSTREKFNFSSDRIASLCSPSNQGALPILSDLAKTWKAKRKHPSRRTTWHGPHWGRVFCRAYRCGDA